MFERIATSGRCAPRHRGRRRASVGGRVRPRSSPTWRPRSWPSSASCGRGRGGAGAGGRGAVRLSRAGEWRPSNCRRVIVDAGPDAVARFSGVLRGADREREDARRVRGGRWGSFWQRSRGWLRLHEKGGKRHDVPAHHRATEALDEYVAAANLENGRAALFQNVGWRPSSGRSPGPVDRIMAGSRVGGCSLLSSQTPMSIEGTWCLFGFCSP